jgi:hypothetical protein
MMPSEIIFITDESQLRLAMDPRFVYAPAEFHGTVHWPKITPPAAGNPRDRVR